MKHVRQDYINYMINRINSIKDDNLFEIKNSYSLLLDEPKKILDECCPDGILCGIQDRINQIEIDKKLIEDEKEKKRYNKGCWRCGEKTNNTCSQCSTYVCPECTETRSSPPNYPSIDGLCGYCVMNYSNGY